MPASYHGLIFRPTMLNIFIYLNDGMMCTLPVCRQKQLGKAVNTWDGRASYSEGSGHAGEMH